MPTAAGPLVLPPSRRVDQRPHSSDRLYDHRWRAARLAFLRSHPLCVYCKSEGRDTPASVVDHIIPHRGDAALFWDQANWQSLCAHCHNSKTARGL